MAQSTINPGNIVVPLSEIIDQLQGKLNAADLNGLLLAVVGQKKNKVQPGDIITADFINQILSDLEDINIRVSKLESSGTSTIVVRISGFNVTPPLHINDPVEIDGAGFFAPAVLNKVTMGGLPVNDLTSDGTANKLFFLVPPISLPSSGDWVRVTVKNDNGSATSEPIFVFPAAPIAAGQTQLIYSMPPIMPDDQRIITAGKPYTFVFNLKFIPATNNTVTNATYTVTPTITGTGWSANTLDTNPIVVGVNSTKSVHIQVTAGTGVGVLSLKAVEGTTETHIALGQSLPLSITENNPPPTPDNRVLVTLNDVAGGASMAGTTIQFKRKQSGGIQFTILFAEGGDYVINPVMRATTGWTTDSIDVPIYPNLFQVTAPPRNQTTDKVVNVWFTAGDTAASTDLLFALTRADGLSITYSQSVTIIN